MDLNNIYKEILTEAIDQNKIIKAIQEKRVLAIYYKADREENEVTGWRKIEPFCCGINKFGNPVLRAWQTSGVSNSYPPGKDGSNGGKRDPLTFVPGWRMFRMDKIVSLVTENVNFTAPRPKYNPNDKDMTTVYAAADFGNNGQPTTSQPVVPTPAPTTQKPLSAPSLPPQQPVAPVAPKQAPVQPKLQNPVLPQIKHHTQPTKAQSYLDKLTDKFKRLINYRPGKR